jgi:endonuclease-3 related protein
MPPRRKLLSIYDRLYNEFGPRLWWPADTPFEVIIGAILTQNTAWTNVEKAITNLKKKKLLTPASLKAVPGKTLAKLIHPAGYYNIKAKRLKNFTDFLFCNFKGDLAGLFRLPTEALREALLSVNGIGPETADSILLYAANRPVFVVDAYTKRMLIRHKMIKAKAGYDEIQSFFMDNLPANVKVFNEYHALIVELGKTYCKKKPLCHMCPLR